MVAQERYLSWQEGGGLFNNVRLALQSAALLAVGLNRTLVWPPRAPDSEWTRKTHHDYLRDIPEPELLEDFYDMDRFRRGPVRSISYASFVTRVGLVGHGYRYKNIHHLNETLVLERPRGSETPAQLVLCVPRCPSTNCRSCVKEDLDRWDQCRLGYKINAEDTELMRTVHIKGWHYYFVGYFQDTTLQHDVKSAVSGSLRYRPEIYERAGRLIQALGGRRQYSCIHLRLQANFLDDHGLDTHELHRWVVNTAKNTLIANEVLYVASDQWGLCTQEGNAATLGVRGKLTEQFFSSLTSVYNATCFYHYRSLLLHDTSDAWIPLIEQLACSEARVYFSATPASSFSEYIEELRDQMDDDIRHTDEQQSRKQQRGIPCYSLG